MLTPSTLAVKTTQWPSQWIHTGEGVFCCSFLKILFKCLPIHRAKELTENLCDPLQFFFHSAPSSILHMAGPRLSWKGVCGFFEQWGSALLALQMALKCATVRGRHAQCVPIVSCGEMQWSAMVWSAMVCNGSGGLELCDCIFFA